MAETDGAPTAANSFGANGLLSRNVGGTSSGSTFYTFDPQGSVCQRFGSSANLLSSDQYDAFGLLQATTQTGAADVFGFGAQWGYQSDPETGLLLLTNRYYDPGLARFLTRDPIGQADGLNLYEYVGNGPVNFADPAGLIDPEDAIAYGSGIVGGVGGFVASGFDPVGAAVGFGEGVVLADLALGQGLGESVAAGAEAACDVASVAEMGAAGVSALPRGGQLSLPFEDFEPSDTEALAARATAVSQVLDDEFAENRRTVAVLQTSMGRIVGAGAEKDPTLAQVAAVEGAGEIPARLPGKHAEITVLTAAAQLGVPPESIGTSRKFCPECRAAIEASGGRILTLRTAIWPKGGE